MSMVRVPFQLPADTLAQIDAARGLIPRAAWIRRALERELGIELPLESERGRQETEGVAQGG